MSHATRTAHRAYGLALAQLDRLRAGDVDGYLSSEQEFEAVYGSLRAGEATLAGEPTVDAESEATIRALEHVQAAICGELDALVERAADAIAGQRQRRAAVGAYHASTAARLPGAR